MPSQFTTCPECGRRPEKMKGKLAQGGGLGGLGAISGAVSGLKIPRAALFAIGGVLLLGLVAWFGWRNAGTIVASGPAASGSETSLFRMSGSNTIGSELGPELVKAWLGSKGATNITSDLKKVPNKDAAETTYKAQLDGRTVTVEVRPHGTSTAFSDLLGGTADIGMASRAIKPAEADSLKPLGDMRTPTSENVVGLDGLAVIVNRDNPIGALSTAVLQKIFTGQVKNWSEIGGPAGAITLYTRNNKSGTYDTFKDLVLRGKPLEAKAKRFEDSTELEAAVAADRLGIGFVGLPYVKTTHALAVNDGQSAPLQPTSVSVRTESYPLARRLYLYSSPQSSNRDVRDFIAFALSPAGQAVVRKVQFVDLDIAAAAAAPVAQAGAAGPAPACQLSANWPGDRNAYCNLRKTAEALQTTFRFKAGSDTLDTRAIADLRRVLARMEQTPNKKIVLAGFSDDLGAASGNCALSTSRGQRVAQALGTLGLEAAEVIGFCSELPVRDNGTPEGRDQNRRVEIFLR